MVTGPEDEAALLFGCAPMVFPSATPGVRWQKAPKLKQPLYHFIWKTTSGSNRDVRGRSQRAARKANAGEGAHISGRAVSASIDVTDQSMGRGRSFRDHEYSRRSWVRFLPGEAPERLNTRVIDALKQLNLGGEAVASRSPPLATVDRSN